MYSTGDGNIKLVKANVQLRPDLLTRGWSRNPDDMRAQENGAAPEPVLQGPGAFPEPVLQGPAEVESALERVDVSSTLSVPAAGVARR